MIPAASVSHSRVRTVASAGPLIMSSKASFLLLGIVAIALSIQGDRVTLLAKVTAARPNRGMSASVIVLLDAPRCIVG